MKVLQYEKDGVILMEFNPDMSITEADKKFEEATGMNPVKERVSVVVWKKEK